MFRILLLRNSQMCHSFCRDHPTTRRPLNKSFAEQKRLHFIFQRIRRNIHGVPQRLNARGTAGKDMHDRVQVFPILFFQSGVVNSLHLECRTGYLQRDFAICPNVSVVTGPAEPVVSLARRTSGSDGNFLSSLWANFCALAGVARDDGGQLFFGVKI